MKASIAVLPVLLYLFSPCAAKLTFKAGKASVVNSKDVGSDERVLSFDPSRPRQPLQLGADDVLKLTFTVSDDKENVAVQPHQTFLRFWDAGTDEEGIVPVKVTKDGKAKFSLSLRKPPTGLPPTTTNPLHVSLILGSFTYKPASFELFDLTLPPSGVVAPHPEEVTFHVQSEIHHTFRPEQKVPVKGISLVFAALALSPWAVLLSLLSQLPISVTPTSRKLPFLLLLGGFEGLLFWYWVDLYLGQVLAYGAVLGLLTAIAGKRALSQ